MGRVFNFLATVSNWIWLTADRSFPLLSQQPVRVLVAPVSLIDQAAGVGAGTIYRYFEKNSKSIFLDQDDRKFEQPVLVSCRTSPNLD
jgi:hypothetical protein